ncbi:MAG: DUF4872 domain-containing protein [Promethearchaeota archaeon]
MIIEGYSHFGATERVAGALRNIMDHYGVLAPHTGEPFTEALLMGIGGGLGAEYYVGIHKGIDLSRKAYNRLYLRFNHTRNYIQKQEDNYLPKTAARIGAHLTIKETVSQTIANQFLSESLQAGKPVIVKLSIWQGLHHHPAIQDRYKADPDVFSPLLYGEFINFLPYYTLPFPWITEHLIIVYGIDEEAERVLLSDFSNQPLTLSISQFIESRSIMKKWKNLAYTINPPKTNPDLAKAIRLGINDCVESLLCEKSRGASTQIGTRAWRTMAVKVGDIQGKRGWVTLFNEPWQLFDSLTQMHAQIAFFNSDGGALRSSYADFLEEASDILKKPELKHIAHQFSDIGIIWDEIGTTALNDDVPELLHARQTALDWHNTFKVHGSAKTNSLEALSMELRGIRAQFSEKSPFTPRELLILFEELSARLFEVYDAETSALKALRLAMK